MAFSIGKLQFLDSLQFTMDSLENLVKTLKTDEEFRYTHHQFNNEGEFALVKQKGIFPNGYFDDISTILSTEEMNFPTMETFFNKMEDKECTVKYYLQAKLAWQTFKCKTFAQYH